MELTSGSEGNPGSKSHIKKRVENACQPCKTKKRRCDGNLPSCSACSKQGLSCIYLQARKRGKGKMNAYVQNLERKLANLENSLLRSGLIQDQGSSGPSYASDHRSDEIATKTLGSTSEIGSGDVRPLVNTGGRSSTPLPPTEECSTSRVVGRAYETSIPGSDLPTIGTNSEISTVREKFFALLPGENVARRLRDQIRRGPFTRSIFANLPPKAHLESLFEVSFNDINCQWPLFDPSNLILLLDEEYESDSSSIHKSPAGWALLNSAIAIAIQSKAAEDSYSDMTDLSWHFFKNSFSVFSAIVSRGTDVLALEALLAMALFMQGSSDVRTTSLLISEAARLSTTLGFHKSSFYVGMDPVTAERHRRAFWIAYILDKDISIKTGMPSAYNDDDISLEYTSSDSLGCPGKSVVSGICVKATVFRLRAQLAVIESAIQNQLYFEKTAKCGAERCLQAVVELDYRLVDWKGQVPLNIQPGHINWSTVRPLREPILSLHFVYYRAMSAVHSFAAHMMPINDVNFLSQSISSDSIHATMAHESIQLLQFLPSQAPGDLWQILFHPLSACIALVAIVLKHPTDVRAQSHLRHIGDFVKFLVNVEKCGVLQIKHMLHLCIELEKLGFAIVTAETNIPQSTESSVGNQKLHARAQRLTSHEAFYGNHMQLAQGLVGNIPTLQAIAANIFHDMLPTGAKSSPTAGVLAPALLNPETYQFAFT